jgi:hypothetical protein
MDPWWLIMLGVLAGIVLVFASISIHASTRYDDAAFNRVDQSRVELRAEFLRLLDERQEQMYQAMDLDRERMERLVLGERAMLSQENRPGAWNRRWNEML